ncbi:molybdate ABC transporter substrate-binding protein [Pendulispora brunnea]|uniref:Molybdate ABC transporter substrate-binding protein n=1 Tax=Pendulispora brunnea TaxID=2905690 RepID=A0ABZ2KJ33_9BACT
MSARSFTKIDAPLLLAVMGGALVGVGCQGKQDASKQQSTASASASASSAAQASEEEHHGNERPLKVAAASDLAKAFEEVGRAYEAKSGKKVVFSFGSSGLLAKQIAEGAPFDVFAAANQAFADEAVRSGACFQEGQAIYARGRIVVWTKKGTVAPPKTLAELKERRFTKIAIANPEHAPYGRAAKEALASIGAWEAVSKKVVYGENIQQTFQFAQSGNADVAIVALSLAMGAEGGAYVPIDPGLHAPLDQKLVVCKGGSREEGRPRKHASGFADYVGSEEGRAIMKRYGFLLPGESPAP